MNLVKELADYLAARGVGAVGADVFVGGLPEEPSACIAVLDTGGFGPDADLPLVDPTVEILCRAADYETANAKAWQVYSLLNRKFELRLATIRVLSSFAMHPPRRIPPPDAKRCEYVSVNFKLRVVES